jgi:hypothetical protein
MLLAPEIHQKGTAALARKLSPKNVYEWLVTVGYFPEPFVVPPCFSVTKWPSFGKRFFRPNGRKYNPKQAEYLNIQFPKSNYTDRTFGIVDPELHSDVALTIAENWDSIVAHLFHKKNKVCSYSFPIPVNRKSPGVLGKLRSGRMIYEFLAMAENDLASIAYRYSVMVKTDVKNFYPSLYTHSIPWALHQKTIIRAGGNRSDPAFFGNRLDKLFQNMNDGCTNGLPVGPAVSDVVSEIVLAAVDRLLSEHMPAGTIAVRFKDDYRILAKSEDGARTAVKQLQGALKEYRLELNDDKTEFFQLPAGLFREWVSDYHAANPHPKRFYSYRRFKETYLAVVKIDKTYSHCGVIDRFLADIVIKGKTPKLRVQLDKQSLPKVVSLLLMLGRLRTKAFPKVLATIEAILKSPNGNGHGAAVANHLRTHLLELQPKESENRYLIAWICYFLRANDLHDASTLAIKLKDPIARAVHTSQFSEFKACPDFKVFVGVKAAAKMIALSQYLDAFRPQ